VRGSFVRSLVLTFSLLLALPQWWCCMLQFQAPGPRGQSDTPGPRSCCGHCRQPGKPTGSTRPAPEPLPPGKCPCTDRDAASPAPKAADADLSLTAPLGVADLAPTAEGPARVVGLPVTFFDNPFRHLSCVRLC
jgi:hypothetical protein